ncbi:MAG: AAA domain-containing protein [Acidimicrobiia bacterium]|nr:AAA domain-containing protein [Acidimicrobiia bacterium]
MRRFGESGGFDLGRTGSPWLAAWRAGSIRTPDDASQALRTADSLVQRSLPSTMGRLRAMLGQVGLREPESVAGWSALFSLLDDVAGFCSRWDSAMFALPHADVASALARIQKGAGSRLAGSLFDGNYRATKKQVRAMAVGNRPNSEAIYAAVGEAAALVERWRGWSFDGGLPRLPYDLSGDQAAYGQLVDELRAIGAYLGNQPSAMHESRVTSDMAALVADQPTLYKLPELYRIRAAVYRLGLGDLLDECMARELDTDAAVEVFRYTWMSSILEHVSLTDPTIGGFDGDGQRRVVADYRRRDVEHLREAPSRIRRLVAERPTAMRDQHPEESTVVAHQARLKRRHMPVRSLMEAAPHILGALKPCWAMSPLIVAEMLPAQKLFDVVIFDEASQVRQADAVLTIARGDQVVVAGDSKQLPPSNFFLSEVETDEVDDEEATSPVMTKDLESILDTVSALSTAQRNPNIVMALRSRCERLISFSRRAGQSLRLVTHDLPGRGR